MDVYNAHIYYTHMHIYLHIKHQLHIHTWSVIFTLAILQSFI